MLSAAMNRLTRPTSDNEHYVNSIRPNQEGGAGPIPNFWCTHLIDQNFPTTSPTWKLVRCLVVSFIVF